MLYLNADIQARGKSGPLFHFDVHDDVRMTGDHRIEKDEVLTRCLNIVTKCCGSRMQGRFASGSGTRRTNSPSRRLDGRYMILS